jgi:hypothetical protein
MPSRFGDSRGGDVLYPLMCRTEPVRLRNSGLIWRDKSSPYSRQVKLESRLTGRGVSLLRNIWGQERLLPDIPNLEESEGNQ